MTDAYLHLRERALAGYTNVRTSSFTFNFDAVAIPEHIAPAPLIESGADPLRFAFCFWARSTSTGGFYPIYFGRTSAPVEGIALLWDTTIGLSLRVLDSAKGLTGQQFNSGGADNPAFWTGQWVHLGVALRAGSVEFFVNGLSTTVRGALVTRTNTLTMTRTAAWTMACGNSLAFETAMADLRVWKGVDVDGGRMLAAYRGEPTDEHARFFANGSAGFDLAGGLGTHTLSSPAVTVPVVAPELDEYDPWTMLAGLPAAPDDLAARARRRHARRTRAAYLDF